MNSFRKELWFNIPARMDFVNITPEVDTCLRESGIQEGLCLVNGKNIQLLHWIRLICSLYWIR